MAKDAGFVGAWPRVGLLALTLGAAGGCWTQRSADRAVRHTLRDDAARVQALTGTNALADALTSMADNRAASTNIPLDLPTALRLAQRYSRTLQTKREQLYLSGLSTLGTLRKFGVLVDGTVGFVMNWPEDATDASTLTLGLGASRRLYTGGTLTANAQSDRTRTLGVATNATAYTSTASLELRQPLLAGAGFEASHEEWTQARRDLVYALRDFALQRQDFAIGILRSYYDLLMQKTVLENTRQNVAQSTYLRRRSEAMFKVRQAAAIDVMRSQQQELSASNTLSLAEAEFDVAVSRFLAELGLPASVRAEITGTVPDLRPMSLDMERCQRTALTRRLDLITQIDRLEDARRQVRVARNGLLPQLDAYGKAAVTGQSEDSATDAKFQRDASAGVTLKVPLDQRDERDNVRRARIAADAAARALDAKKDDIAVSITESFRQLEAYRRASEIEMKNADLAARRADYANFRFKSGDLSNRDVVEAQNELLAARNAYAQALVQYEEQRVQLLRDTGLLDVGANGLLVEMPQDLVRNADQAQRP